MALIASESISLGKFPIEWLVDTFYFFLQNFLSLILPETLKIVTLLQSVRENNKKTSNLKTSWLLVWALLPEFFKVRLLPFYNWPATVLLHKQLKPQSI